MSMRSPNGFIRPGYDPLEVADAPTGVTPAAGNQSASVDFTPPADVGGSAVSEYYAVVQPGGITGTSVTPPVAVTGLTNGVEYTTKVWANNSYGPSPYSEESSGFTPSPPGVEDVFSTYLYTGNGSTQTITNGIDFAGEGGLAWFKARVDTTYHTLFDTERGTSSALYTNVTNAAGGPTNGVTSFNSDGFTLGSLGEVNYPYTFASWSFRKAPKFFDVVTYTGTGTTQNIAHSLDSVPGCIIVKRTDAAENWGVYHRSIGATGALRLNQTAGTSTLTAYWNNTNPTSTQFTVGSNSQGNASGGSYVAYLFAHNAGGFGNSGAENIISCGSFTSTGQSINLGFEPQFLLAKKISGDSDWLMFDNMRSTYGRAWRNFNGFSDETAWLKANLSAAESYDSNYGFPEATGFYEKNFGGGTWIYIAIRRGPMKAPNSGSEVFDPKLASGVSSLGTTTFDITTDAYLQINRNGTAAIKGILPRLTGVGLLTYSTASESSAGTLTANFGISPQNAVERPVLGGNSSTAVVFGFKRAPGFFDVVTYTGNDVLRTINHNLGVAPEMMIIKNRNSALDWAVYHSGIGNTKYIWFNRTDAAGTESTYWNNTSPTSSVFTVSTSNKVNSLPSPYIAYLFATLAGVSKVGSYTGTAANLDVDCGFSAGARFILIKRTDSSGDWYVWDSARGIVSGTDPYSLLNTTAAENTSTDYIDPLASGFTVTSSAPVGINASGGTYIFLAIA